MDCPKCSANWSVITATRNGAEVGRDRTCSVCKFAWQTTERIDDELYVQPPESMTLQEEVAHHRDRILELCQS